MAHIKKLPPQETQKIAAGEVVDRPVNVVKELIENAIDAKATSITLHIENGGKNLIRIVDNGYGMNSDDAHLCFEHHATSKIKMVTDLDSISTFGFRGEALSSIAAVSKITLNTQTAEAAAGISLQLEQTKIVSEEKISRKTGTDISIKDLFYNLPARKKFLKTKETEWRHIIQLFYAFCLSYRSIHFILYSDGKQIHNCPPAKEIIDRTAQLWGHNITQHILKFELNQTKDFCATGAISNHIYSRFDRSMIFLFVNNRWIKNIHLSRALLRGYSNVLQPSQYPMAFIFITVNPMQIDVNIHPRKEEVKFLHPRIFETALQDAVKTRLHKTITQQLNKTHIQQESSRFSQSPINKKVEAPVDNVKQPFNVAEKIDEPITFDFKSPVFTEKNDQNHDSSKKTTPPIKEPTNPDVTNEAISGSSHSHNIIGQMKKTYILLEQESGLFLVDQHAAHERILYEQFSKRFEEIATTKLLFPQIIKLNINDINCIEPHLPLFKKNGIEIEVFGDDQLIIHSTPVNLKNLSLESLIQETIGWAIEYKNLDHKELHKRLNEKIHAKMACVAAVKAGDILNMQQMQKLIDTLEKTKNNLTCPHGRPTGWLLPLDEIKKKFKRDYRSNKNQLIHD